MLALQHQAAYSACIMGLGADAAADPTATAAQIEQSITDRVAAIRAQMISFGVPLAVGTGAVTTLMFAGAFGLAHTERVWMPALWLGALTAIGGLISVAVAAKTSTDAATAAAAPAATTTTPPTVTVAPAAPAAFGRWY